MSPLLILLISPAKHQTDDQTIMMIRMEIMVKILMVLITILGSRLIKLNKMMSPLLILLISPAKYQTDDQNIMMIRMDIMMMMLMVLFTSLRKRLI